MRYLRKPIGGTAQWRRYWIKRLTILATRSFRSKTERRVWRKRYAKKLAQLTDAEIRWGSLR